MEEVKRPLIRFGIFEVDLQAGELRRQGVKVKLQQQPFQVLTMLLEHPGEVVTREEIQKRLWPADTFVDFDRGLNRATNRLREALGDDADSPRFIETLPRRGYRLIAQVERLHESPPVPGRMFQQDDTEPTNRSPRSPGSDRARPQIILITAVVGIALLTFGAGFVFLRPQHGPIESVAVLPFSNGSSDPMPNT
jgi:DNA-binding winged helix-turn-helix (wHTH) protein